MNQLQQIQPMTVDTIKTKIHEFRGQKVMLDKDLAELYQVETKVLNQAVKRNIKRFPNDFMFQLSQQEFQILKSQFVTSRWGGVRKLPFAFTEQGLAMLSGLLNSDIAIEVNINIMRAFVAMRHSIDMLKDVNIKIETLQSQMKELNDSVDDILSTQNDINEDTSMQLELLNQSLAELQVDNSIRKKFENREPIGFKQKNT